MVKKIYNENGYQMRKRNAQLPIFRKLREKKNTVRNRYTHTQYRHFRVSALHLIQPFFRSTEINSFFRPLVASSLQKKKKTLTHFHYQCT